MKVNNNNISFKRLLTPIEKIEARAYATEVKKAIGLENLAVVTHTVSLPSASDEDFGIGILSKNSATTSYINFLYDNAIDAMSIEPMGIIKGEFYSPYEGTILSKKTIVDLKELCTNEWANLLDEDFVNEIINNKNYVSFAPTDRDCKKYKIAQFEKDCVIYDYVLPTQNRGLKQAFTNFKTKIQSNDIRALELNQEFEEFKKENDFYLESNSIYSVLNKKYKTQSFEQWENELHKTLFSKKDNKFSQKQKDEEIAKLTKENQDEIEFFKFCQFVVNKQQKKLTQYATNLAQERYEHDLAIINEAYFKKEISKEKYLYLKSKIEEYKNSSQGVNIIGDKQVGYSDMDIFSNPDLFTKDEFMGAPPNLLKASTGQDWDFRFIPYENLFDKNGNLLEGGQYLKKITKKAFEDNPGGLRIDHIIGLIDPWTYQKSQTNAINDIKFNLFLISALKDLAKCGITTEKIKGLNDVIGAINGKNKIENAILANKGGIDFEKANEILKEKEEFLNNVSSLSVPQGSRHIFKYLLNNELSELKKFGLNENTISGVIDPVQGIFNEQSMDRKFLEQNGVENFDEIQKIFLSKKDKLDKIYSNTIEKIILDSAKEVIFERYKKQGILLNEKELKIKASQQLLCEDLGALTLPVKEILKKYSLKGMRDAGRANPHDPSHIYREINPAQQGNYWLIGTHDTLPYKNLFTNYDTNWQNATKSYVAKELNLDEKEVLEKSPTLFARIKTARIFAGDKNPKTPNNVLLNWLDIFNKNRAYNTPGLYDKTQNWILRICSSDENFEKKYYEQILPQKKGINIPESLNIALKACTKSKKYDKLSDELARLSEIAEE